MARSARRSAIRQNFLEADQEPVGGSSPQFARYEKYGRLAKELNIKAEQSRIPELHRMDVP
jgi:hypothetical protein